MNLLILCLDALRDDHVTPEIMPYLSGLAESGTRYRGVKCRTAWTLPSVASMLTGDDDAFEKGSEGMVGRPTLAEMLGRTHATGAFLGQPVVATTPELRWIWDSFDYAWRCSDSEDWWVAEERGMDEVWIPFLLWKAHRITGILREPEVEPWFAYLHLYEVHEPYTTGPILAGMPHTIENGYFTDRLNRTTWQNDITKGEGDTLRGLYVDYCRATDAKLAKWLPEVLDDDTILFVVSDHGDCHGEGGVWGHGWADVFQQDAARRLFWAVVGPDAPKGVATPNGPITNAFLPYIVVEYLRTGNPEDAIDTDAVQDRLRELGYLGG